MRYYFFQTSMQMREGEMRPTLRALPGQTFPDGSEVSTEINVRSPKKAGESIYGTREEYPLGTHFCSTFLEPYATSNGVTVYTVFAPGTPKNPDFHPVSDDPDFNFVAPQHKSDTMQAAFVRFMNFGDQGKDNEPAPATKATAKAARGKARGPKAPKDAKGVATPLQPIAYEPAYEDQLEQEGSLIVLWMRKTLNARGIRSMVVRPKLSDTVRERISALYGAGETIDSIAHTARFDAVCGSEKMDTVGLQNITKGPLQWYLDVLYAEHANGSESTAAERDAVKDAEDPTFIVCTELNTLNGSSDSVTPAAVADMSKALQAGWTVSDILNPAVLGQKGTLDELVKALADGSIPPPVKGGATASFIERMMADKKNAVPKDKDGFHVDEMTWKILLRNVYQHQPTLLLGPSGTGKTEIVRLLSERTGMPLTIIPMGAITDPTEQLIGKMDLDPSTNGTRFDWADFALAIQQPGIVLLDEINRCPRNGTNTLFNVLDGVRQLVASGAKSTDQRVVKVNKDCVFFATANIGAEYVNTQEIDQALKTRFMPVEVDYLTIKEETAVLVARTGVAKEDAFNIATVAASIRKEYNNSLLEQSISTRETLRCAELVRDGFDVEEALSLAFLPNFKKGVTDKDPDSERGKVRGIIAGRLNITQ